MLSSISYTLPVLPLASANCINVPLLSNDSKNGFTESSSLCYNYYPPNVAVQGSYASGNTSAQTWRMKGYTYRESGTNRSRFAKSHLIIWEVEI